MICVAITNLRNDILTKLTQEAKAHNLNGTSVFRCLVEGWIAAGCPPRFEVKKKVHTQSSKELWLSLMERQSQMY